jgi:hypothetical protein
VALAATRAQAEALAQGADAGKAKAADEAAAKAKTDAATAGASPEAAELAALQARAGALAKDASPEKVKQATDAAKAAEAVARQAVSGGARLGALAYGFNDKPPVSEANIYGGQQALKITAGVPATMAVCYLLLVVYFVSKGGYKQIHLEDEDTPDRRPGEKYTGGVEGPVR